MIVKVGLFPECTHTRSPPARAAGKAGRTGRTVTPKTILTTDSLRNTKPVVNERRLAIWHVGPLAGNILAIQTNGVLRLSRTSKALPPLQE
jgi:hypothetical protein